MRALFSGVDPVVLPYAADGVAVTEAVTGDAAHLLREREERVREDLAGEAPPYDAGAAGWAARAFYRACQFLVDREPGEEVVRAALAPACPSAPGASTAYSVDLVFCFLPDLLRLAEQRAPGEALTVLLRGWAREWPLSSVGAAAGDVTPGDDVLAQPALRRLYLDRIVERGAKDRLGSPALRRWIEADAGAYPELAGKFAILAPSPAPAPTPASISLPSSS